MFLPVADALAKAVLEFCKRRMEYVAPGDDDIVVSGRHCKPGGKTDRLFQAPAHPVPFDGIAMLLRHGETDARRSIRLVPVAHLEKEQRPFALFSLPHIKKLRAAFQPSDSHFLVIFGHCPALASGKRGL